MRKLALGTIIIITAVVTALLTSLFWIAAYNVGGGHALKPPAAPAPAPSASPPSEAAPPRAPPSGLVIPVVGIRAGALRDTFTEARAAGARVHDAIDIMAPAGTPVVAATDGTVEKLFFSNGGGGITAYVRSPDRLWSYYYAHLQSYAPALREGQHVARGDLIGFVGSTGNANPAAPHLHFAINAMRPDERWWQGTPINPYPLLARR